MVKLGLLGKHIAYIHIQGVPEKTLVCVLRLLEALKNELQGVPKKTLQCLNGHNSLHNGTRIKIRVSFRFLRKPS